MRRESTTPPPRACLLALGLLFAGTPAVQAERLWEQYGLELHDGRRLWATLDRDLAGGCFKLNAGSNALNVAGLATNCAPSLSDPTSSWMLQACQRSSVVPNRRLNDVIQELVDLCLR